MPIRERRDGDRDLLTSAEALCIRMAGNLVETEGATLCLNPMNELHKLPRCREVPQKVVVLGHTLRRIAAKREKARDTLVEELTNDAARFLIGRSDAGEMSHRVHPVFADELAEYRERCRAIWTGRSVGYRDEFGIDGRKPVNRRE